MARGEEVRLMCRPRFGRVVLLSLYSTAAPQVPKYARMGLHVCLS